MTETALSASITAAVQALVMGVDPGLVCTAYCVIERRGTRRRYVASGSIKPIQGLDDLGRARFIAHALNVAISDHHPDAVCLETYSYQGKRSHNANALRVSKLVGHLTSVATSAACVPVVVTMGKGAINQRLGLKGKVPKARVRRAVEAMLRGAKLKNEHEVDAAAAALAAVSEAVDVVRKAAGKQ